MLSPSDIAGVHELLNDWELAIQKGYGIPVAIGKQQGIIDYFRQLQEKNAALEERLVKAGAIVNEETHFDLCNAVTADQAGYPYGPCGCKIDELKELLRSPTNPEK